MDTGKKIYTLRTENGMTQEELAIECHVSLQTVMNWESGREMPEKHDLLELCDIFGVTEDHFQHTRKGNPLKAAGYSLMLLSGSGLLVLLAQSLISDQRYVVTTGNNTIEAGGLLGYFLTYDLMWVPGILLGIAAIGMIVLLAGRGQKEAGNDKHFTGTGSEK